MEELSIRRLGGNCSILVGVAYIIYGAMTILDLTQNGSAPWQAHIQSPGLFVAGAWSVTIAALLALAVIPAVAQLIEATSPGWVNWLSKIAYLGFFVTALSNVQSISIDVLYASIDPQRWLGLGCVGLWVFGANVLALRAKSLPKPLAYLGLVVAVMYGLAIAGIVNDISILTTIAAGIGGVILAPTWYIGVGRLLRR